MKMELNAYEITEAIQDYLVKRGIGNPEGDCFTDCFEMLFSTTEYKSEVKKHKNGKPVMQTINGHKTHVWHTTEIKEVWHSFNEDNDLSIWI